MYVYTQDVPIDESMYAKIGQQLGPEPMDGLVLHIVVRRPEGGLRYIDVWESREQCARAFDTRIHQAVDAAFGGQRPATEPVVHVLDVVEMRGSALASV